jgi:hypothetical protein
VREDVKERRAFSPVKGGTLVGNTPSRMSVLHRKPTGRETEEKAPHANGSK